MNFALSRHQIISALFRHKYNSQTQLIHEAPVLFKKMLQPNHHPLSNSPNYSQHSDTSCKYRSWKQVSFREPSPQKSGLPFNIVSYNILSQDILIQHLYLYRNVNQSHLKWSHRLPRLTEQIIEQNPDIVCLQEVQENQLEDIMANIKARIPSMCYIFKKKTGTKPDGCAIVYNTKLFQLVVSEVVEFFRPEIQLLDRHNIAIIAKFRCTLNKDAHLLISTTHLLYNPKRQDVRLAQIMILLAELDRHSIVKPGKLDRMPVILTGDFNFQPNSAPFKLITSGKLCYEDLSKKSLIDAQRCSSPPTGKQFISNQLRITDNCQHISCVVSDYTNCPQQTQDLDENQIKLFSTGTLTHDLRLRSVYNHFDGMPLASIFQGGWVAVDHMFFSKHSKKNPRAKNGILKLLSVYQLPTVNECKLIRFLPNEKNGSDHLLLAARFDLKFPLNK